MLVNTKQLLILVQVSYLDAMLQTCSDLEYCEMALRCTSKKNWNLEDIGLLVKANHSGLCSVLGQCISHMGLNINIH